MKRKRVVNGMRSPKKLLLLLAVLLTLSLRLVADVPHNEPLRPEVELKPDRYRARPLHY